MALRIFLQINLTKEFWLVGLNFNPHQRICMHANSFTVILIFKLDTYTESFLDVGGLETIKLRELEKKGFCKPRPRPILIIHYRR